MQPSSSDRMLAVLMAVVAFLFACITAILFSALLKAANSPAGMGNSWWVLPLFVLLTAICIGIAAGLWRGRRDKGGISIPLWTIEATGAILLVGLIFLARSKQGVSVAMMYGGGSVCGAMLFVRFMGRKKPPGASE